MLFRDDGQWWSKYFGSDGTAPWRECSGVLCIAFDAESRLRRKQP
jgi:hypothetical protein